MDCRGSWGKEMELEKRPWRGYLEHEYVYDNQSTVAFSCLPV